MTPLSGGRRHETPMLCKKYIYSLISFFPVSFKCHQHYTVSVNICFWSLKQGCVLWHWLAGECLHLNGPEWPPPTARGAQSRPACVTPIQWAPLAVIPRWEYSARPALSSWQMVNVLLSQRLTLTNYAQSVQLSPALASAVAPEHAATSRHHRRTPIWELHHEGQPRSLWGLPAPQRPLSPYVDK